MANRWGNNGNSERLYFGAPKLTADGGCSHEIKRHLLLGRKAMTKLDSILKSRDITLLTKVLYSHRYGFLSSHVQFVTLWTVVCQAPLSMGFSSQKYWSGLPFPSPRDLPDPGIEPGFPELQADSLLAELPRKPLLTL